MFYVDLTQLEIQIERIRTELRCARELEQNIVLLKSMTNSEEELYQLIQIGKKLEVVIFGLRRMQIAFLELRESMMVYRIETSATMERLGFQSKQLFK